MRRIPRMTGASWETLKRRTLYNNRKGRSAKRRIARILRASYELALFLR